MYRGTIKRYIKDSIGVNQLNKVKVLHVQQWLNYLQDEKKISQKTIRNSFFLLNNIFHYAMKWSYVKSNPCELATLQARGRKEADYYTNDEVIALLDKLATLPKDKLYLRIGIMLTLFTGMRKGELMGLSWDDVDFDNNTLSINKTRQYTADFGSYTDTPKTRTSVRKVSFPQECAILLKDLQLHQIKQRLKAGSKWEGADFIFLNDFGAPMCANGFSKLFKAFLERSELRVITFHQLRHTHASLLRYLNVDEMQISRRLGHSDLSTTRNIYTHLFANTDQSVSEKISETFLKSGTEK
jgi:integrase